MSTKKAEQLYEKFYDFEPRSVTKTPLTIPKTVTCVGKAVAIMYASDKWERKVNYYKHDFETAVKIYAPGGDHTTPDYIASVQAMTKLGRAVGAIYVENGKEVNIAFPGCDLYAIPSGKALVVVHKKSRVDALFWGGKLTITAHGIEN